MSRPLWIALLVSLVLSAWIATQQDDDLGVEVVRRNGAPNAASNGGSVSPGSGPASRTADTRAADTRKTDTRTSSTRKPSNAPPKPAELAASAAAVRLVVAVPLWRSRTVTLMSTPAPYALSAWASQQPPPPPPPPPMVAVEPPPPMAPPFPHAWVGRFTDEHARAVIAGPTNTWVVKAGDVMDGEWRVDTINERQMSLTYLPLQQAQTVRMK